MSTFYSTLAKHIENNRTLEIKFTKKDGKTRWITCVKGFDGRVTDTYAVVYDVEAKGYRTIRADAVLEYTMD